MEGDEASYREACDDVELFNFGEVRSPCQEVSEGEDLIDFHGAYMSCQEENEGRDLIDFSGDVTQDSTMNPLAEEYQPSHHPVLIGGSLLKPWSLSEEYQSNHHPVSMGGVVVETMAIEQSVEDDAACTS